MNPAEDDLINDDRARPNGLCYLIGRLDHALNRRIRDALTPLGLTVSQYTALSFLENQPQISNAQLAERSLISPQSANELIKLMEGKGWVERVPDPSHGRIVRISLTDAGSVLLNEAHAHVSALENAMLARFSNGQRNVLQQNMRQMLHALSAHLIDQTLGPDSSR
ncbi:MAG: MarR family winged helix-turn-helix transcriptional regulator [Zoogloea sp.]|uniref:MarR family winged helix-turn-helix transcriptional regulator n=1 Tax=Zoogloea sp. TaxID=49181 RepID=UPI003F30FC4B